MAPRMRMNGYGMVEWDRVVGDKPTAEMLSPVRCSYCRSVYDLCSVETADPSTGRAYGRYADCTMYRTPCCRRIVDDRPAGWVSRPAFVRLEPTDRWDQRP